MFEPATARYRHNYCNGKPRTTGVTAGSADDWSLPFAIRPRAEPRGRPTPRPRTQDTGEAR